MSSFWKKSCLLTACLIPLCSLAELKIVATTTQIEDLLERLCADKAEVSGLMGPGVDPHLYKASARDIRTLQSADIIFFNGLHLEGRMAQLFERLSDQGKPVYALSDALDASHIIFTDPSNLESADPHIWMDPELWSLSALHAAQILSNADPLNAETYQNNAQAFIKELKTLNHWAKEQSNNLNPDKRYLITSHDAYNYFGRAFNFRVIGVQGLSTLSEAGLADITRIVDFIREKQIPAIFVESSVSPAAIERISSDSGARVGGELYSDAMGPKGAYYLAENGNLYELSSYEGMLRYNVETIVKSLQ